MLFTTPITPEEELEIKNYMAKHPYAPFVRPSQKEIDDAKSLLQSIKESRTLAALKAIK